MVGSTKPKQNGEVSAVSILLRDLHGDDPTARRGAAMALGRMGAVSALPDLLQALHDTDSDVRQAAAWALGQLGDARATPGLVEALHDEDSEVRWVTAVALGWIGDEATTSERMKVLRDVAAARTPRDRRKRRSAHRRFRFDRRVLVVAGILVTLVGTFGFLAAQVWHRPLGPELVRGEDFNEVTTGSALPNTADPVNTPLCGGPAAMNLLVIGSDARTGDYASGFADVIRIIRIDFTSPSATLLAIPRDLWVPIPGLERHGVTENRLKTAYAYGNTYEVPGGGPSLLAQTLAENFGLGVDHYIVVNFGAFETGIDAIDGIDVNAPEQVGSPTTNADYFPAGLQHMDGATALQFARVREDVTDLGRIERQTQVILAIRRRVLSPQILPALPELVRTMQGSVLTDLSPAEVSSLVCIGQRIEDGSIHVMNIDSSMTTPLPDPWGFEILTPDYEAIDELIGAFYASSGP